jgi:hypothetical protein
MRRTGGLTLVLALAACGHEQHFTDAGTDADVVADDDANPPDAIPSGDVTITVHSRCCTEANGTLRAGVHVYAIQPDGTAGPSGTTDASGQITLSGVQAGAAVTVDDAVDTTDNQLITWLAVQPGDQLVAGDHYEDAIAGVAGSVTASWPVFTGANGYRIFERCGQTDVGGESTTSTAVILQGACQSPTSTYVFYAVDVSNNVLATGVVHDAAHASGDAVALPAWTTVVPNNVTATIQSLPAGTSSLDLGIEAVFDDVLHENTYAYADPSGGTATRSDTIWPDSDRIFVYADYYRDGAVGEHQTMTSIAGDATSTTLIDRQLPWVGQTITNSLTQTLSWTQTAGAYHGAVAVVSWTRVAGKVFKYFAWTIVLPPGVTDYSWAGAPAGLADDLPGDIDNVNGYLLLESLSTTNDYDDFRAQPEWIVADPFQEVHTGGLTGVNGIAYPYGAALTSHGTGIHDAMVSRGQRRARH